MAQFEEGKGSDASGQDETLAGITQQPVPRLPGRLNVDEELERAARGHNLELSATDSTDEPATA